MNLDLSALPHAGERMARMICAAHVLDKAGTYLLLDRGPTDWAAYQLLRSSELEVRVELAVATMYQLASAQMICHPCEVLQSEEVTA